MSKDMSCMFKCNLDKHVTTKVIYSNGKLISYMYLYTRMQLFEFSVHKVINIVLHLLILIYEPRHEKTCLCHILKNNKCADQLAHPCRLISTFIIRCLDSIIFISSFYIRNFKPLASFCGCAGWFESYLVENPEDRFSHDEAHMYNTKTFKNILKHKYIYMHVTLKGTCIDSRETDK